MGIFNCNGRYVLGLDFFKTIGIKMIKQLSGWEKAMSWRKRQMVEANLKRDYTDIRNQVLEEVAQEFDRMKNGGDTSASFASYVRGMKREWVC
jgi:hypothetical protein